MYNITILILKSNNSLLTLRPAAFRGISNECGTTRLLWYTLLLNNESVFTQTITLIDNIYISYVHCGQKQNIFIVWYNFFAVVGTSQTLMKSSQRKPILRITICESASVGNNHYIYIYIVGNLKGITLNSVQSRVQRQ